MHEEYYIVVLNHDGVTMYCNGERHWTDAEGVIHLRSVDFARKVPVLIPDITLATVIAKRFGGQARKVNISMEDN